MVVYSIFLSELVTWTNRSALLKEKTKQIFLKLLFVYVIIQSFIFI